MLVAGVVPNCDSCFYSSSFWIINISSRYYIGQSNLYWSVDCCFSMEYSWKLALKTDNIKNYFFWKERVQGVASTCSGTKHPNPNSSTWKTTNFKTTVTVCKVYFQSTGNCLRIALCFHQAKYVLKDYGMQVHPTDEELGS